jgi:uncharacterized membrane protein
MRDGKHANANAMGVVGVAALVVLIGASAWTISRTRQNPRADKRRPDMPTLAGGRGLRVERTVTIMRPAADLYAAWRDLRRLPEVMAHLESVTPLEEGRSRWAVRGLADVALTWEAELIADEPGRLIAWRSVAGGDVDNAGSVRFTPAPGDRGTEVKVLLSYAPPAGRLGGAVAAVLGRGGDREVREDLRRFKQRMEADEVAIGGGSSTRGRQPAWSR